MDTRCKILTLDAALALPPGLAIAAGTFDVLRPEHARDLAAIHARPLLVAVLPSDGELLPQRARAELVAGLRMVDYVVIADSGELDRLTGALRPAEVARFEAADAGRARQLIEHVRRRQNL